MDYSFNVEYAKKYGVNEAIMLNNFIFWIKKNIANNSNNFDDNWWTYNSMKAFKGLFPFWSESQIRRILKSLIEQGVLITGNYNKVAYDRTKWYAISISLFEEFHLTISSNGSDESIKPIPYNKPYSKPDNNINPIITSLIESGEVITEQGISYLTDFIKYRKEIKKKVSTYRPLRAYLNTLRELLTKGIDIDEAIALMKEKEWQTIRADWVLKTLKPNQPSINQSNHIVFDADRYNK